MDRVEFEMPDLFHTFRRGHRIMVQVQSTWFPLIDRNTQKYVPSIYQAAKEDFVQATQRVYCTPTMPSHVVLPVPKFVPLMETQEPAWAPLSPLAALTIPVTCGTLTVLDVAGVST